MELLWLFSMWGYVWLTTQRARIPAAFGPLLSMSLVTLLTYFLGLAGWLEYGSIALAAAGAALGAYGLYDSLHTRRAQALIHFGIFCIPCAALLWRYQGALLVAYDDFSHWGLMARHLLTAHAFPTVDAPLITFQSYPPAAACWVYSVGRFWNASDGMMLSAQAWLTLAGFWALFGLGSRENRPAQLIGIPAVCIAGISLFQGTASLMVDNLLAAQATGAFALAVWLRKDGSKAGFCLFTAVLSVLCLIKDSGLLLAGLVWLALIGYRLSQRRWSAPLAFGIPLAAAAIRGLWQWRISLVYPAANTTRHALSLDQLRRMGADKSLEDIAQLGLGVLKRMLSPENQATHMLLILLIAMLVFMFGRRAQKNGRQWTPLLFAAWACLACLAYAVGLWGMYSFSLALETAKKLVAFERYISTCALFLYGCLTAVVLVLCQKRFEVRKGLSVVLALMLLLPYAFPSWSAGIPRLIQENYHVPMRGQMQQLQAQRPLQSGETALLVLDEQNAGTGFAEYMVRYVFQSTLITVTDNQQQADVVYIAHGDPQDYAERAGEVVVLQSNE